MRLIDRLTVEQVQSASPDKGQVVKRLLDGNGLYLQATVSKKDGVNRNWIFRYQLDGERHDYGIGPLSDYGLEEAREKAVELRRLIDDGVDPLRRREEKRLEDKRQRLKQKAERAKAVTFRECGAMYLQRHVKRWKNEKHKAQWRSTLESYAYPVLGDLNVADIDTSHVLKVLTPLWERVPETASRLQKRIEAVLGFAIASEFRTGLNPARWQDHLKTLLGPPQRKVKHHAALPFVEAPQFMADLHGRPSSMSAKALEFTILCATRTNETLGAKWDETNLDTGVWIIPAERMKGGIEHRVPLTDRAIEILESLPKPHRGLVFRGAGGKPLSDMAMLELLRGMRPGHTVHGFRSTFRDWAAERATGFPEFVIEMALAHKPQDAVVKAYKRTDVFPRRVKLMKAWSAFLAKPAVAADVPSLDEERAKRRKRQA